MRGGGVYQSAIDLCIEKCALGHWVHVFPEGKVNMSKEELRLKWGVGRIIYESPKVPIILPLWHEGMDTVLPNVEPYKLKTGKKVTVNVGQPLDLNDFIQDLKNEQVPETVARALITDKVQKALYVSFLKWNSTFYLCNNLIGFARFCGMRRRKCTLSACNSFSLERHPEDQHKVIYFV